MNNILKIKFREILFKFTKWLVRKYFSDGLTPMWGSGKARGEIIAWEWRFYDEAYEKKKNKTK